jgi:hypothetical protein
MTRTGFDPLQPRDKYGKWTRTERNFRKATKVRDLDYETAMALQDYWLSEKPIPQDLRNHFENLRMPDGMTNGEWAQEVITEHNINQTIDDSKGILLDDDRKKLEAIADENDGLSFPYKVTIVDKIDFDPFGDEMGEWGYSDKNTIRPADLMAIGKWDLKQGYFLITLVNHPDYDLRESFWHELSHTLPDNVVEKFVGERKGLKGDWHDRFAQYFAGEWK